MDIIDPTPTPSDEPQPKTEAVKSTRMLWLVPLGSFAVIFVAILAFPRSHRDTDKTSRTAVSKNTEKTPKEGIRKIPTRPPTPSAILPPVGIGPLTSPSPLENSVPPKVRFSFDRLIREVGEFQRIGISTPRREAIAAELIELFKEARADSGPALSPSDEEFWGLIKDRNSKALEEARKARAESLKKIRGDAHVMVTTALRESDLAVLAALKAEAERGENVGAQDEAWAILRESSPQSSNPADDPLIKLLGPVAMVQVEAWHVPVAQKTIGVLTRRIYELVDSGSRPEQVATAIQKDELDLLPRLYGQDLAEARRLRGDAVKKGLMKQEDADRPLTLRQFFEEQEVMRNKDADFRSRIEGELAKFFGRVALQILRKERVNPRPRADFRPFFGPKVGEVLASLIPRSRDERKAALAARLTQSQGPAAQWARKQGITTVGELRERIETGLIESHDTTTLTDAAFASALQRARDDRLAGRLEPMSPRASAARRASVFLDEAARKSPKTDGDQDANYPALRAAADREPFVKLLEKTPAAERLGRAAELLASACTAFENLANGVPLHRGFRLEPIAETWELVPDSSGNLDLSLDFEIVGLVLEDGVVPNAKAGTSARETRTESLSPTGVVVKAIALPAEGGVVLSGPLNLKVTDASARFLETILGARIGSPERVESPEDRRLEFLVRQLDKIPTAAFETQVVLTVDSRSPRKWLISGQVNGRPMGDLAAAVRAERLARLARPTTLNALKVQVERAIRAHGLQANAGWSPSMDAAGSIRVDLARSTTTLTFRIDEHGAVELADLAPEADDALVQTIANRRWGTLPEAVARSLGGRVRSRRGVFEFQPRLYGKFGPNDSREVIGPWVAEEVGKDPSNGIEPGPATLLPGGANVRLDGIARAGDALKLSCRIDSGATSGRVGELLFNGAFQFQAVPIDSSLTAALWNEASHQLVGLLPKEVSFPVVALPLPDVLPLGSIAMTGDGRLAIEVVPGPPLQGVPIRLATSGDQWRLDDPARVAGRLREVLPELARRSEEMTGQLTAWFAQPHSVELGGAKVDLRFDPVAPALGPVTLSGRGELRIGGRRIGVRVTEAKLTHLPRSSSETFDKVFVPGSLRVELVNVDDFTRAQPELEGLVRPLGLKLDLVGLGASGWRLGGSWVPPGRSYRVTFHCESRELSGVSLVRSLLRAAVAAIPNRLSDSTGPFTISLVPAVIDDGDAVLQLDGQAIMAAPASIVLDVRGLRLRRDEKQGWQWDRPAEVRTRGDGLDQIKRVVQAEAERLGLPAALQPLTNSATNPFDFSDIKPTVLIQGHRVDARIDGKVMLAVESAKSFAPDGIAFALDRDGLRIDSENLLARLRDAVIERAQTELGHVGDRFERWIDESLRGVRASELGSSESGLVSNFGLLETRLRRSPLNLGMVRLRAHRVVSCKYYRFETTEDGMATMRFRPVPPQRSPLENLSEADRRQREFERKKEEFSRRAGKFGLEFDAELILPGGAAVEVVGDPAAPADLRPTRGAFRLNGEGLSLQAGSTIRLPGDPLAWLQQTVRGEGSATASAIAELGRSLPIGVRFSLEGLPGVGALTQDAMNLALVADVELTAEAVRGLLGPGTTDNGGPIPLARLRISAREGVKLESTVDRDQVLATISDRLKAVRLAAGPFRLAVDSLVWDGDGIEVLGQVEGVVSTLARVVGGDSPPASENPSLPFRGIVLRRTGLDLSQARIDASAATEFIERRFGQGLLKPINLGGATVRLTHVPELTLQSLRCDLEVRLECFDQPIVVPIEPIVVRFDPLAVSVGGISTAVLDRVIDDVALAIERQIARVFERIKPIRVDGLLSLRLVSARFDKANKQVTLGAIVAVDGYVDPSDVSLSLDVNGRLAFNADAIWKSLEKRIETAAVSKINELTTDLAFWKTLRVAGVRFTPELAAEPKGRVYAWSLLATTDGEGIPVGSTPLKLDRSRVATLHLDLNDGRFEATVNEELLGKFTEKVADEVVNAVHQRIPDVFRLSFLGESFELKPRWDASNGQVVVDLIAAIENGKLVGDTRSDHDRQVRVGPIVLLGLETRQPSFERVRVERPHLLAEWLVGKIGFDKYVQFRRCEFRDWALMIDASLAVPGYLDPVDVTGVTLPIDGPPEEWARALLNPLLGRWQGHDFEMANGVKFHVDAPSITRVTPDVEVAVRLTLSLMDDPPIRIPATLLISGAGVRLAEGAAQIQSLVEAQIKGSIGKFLTEFASFLTDDMLTLKPEIHTEGPGIPVGFSTDGEIALSVLGTDFGSAALSFRGLTIRKGKFELPTGYGLRIPVSIPIGPFALYSLGGSYETRKKEIQLKAKVSIVPGDGPGMLIHFDTTQTIPLAKLTKLQTDGAIVLFGVALANATGILDYENARISQSFETTKLLNDVIKLKGDLSLDFHQKKVTGNLLARLLGCDVTQAILLLDFVAMQAKISGDVNLHVARAFADFQMQQSFSNPTLRAGAKVELPVVGKISELAIDLNVHRAKVRAQVLVAKVSMVFRAADAINLDKISQAILELLNPANLVKGLWELLDGNFNISIGGSVGGNGDGEGNGDGGNDDESDGVGDHETGGEGRNDQYLVGPEGPKLPSQATGIAGGFGTASNGQMIYQFYKLDGHRFVQVTEKPTGRQVQLRADFGEDLKPKDKFNELRAAMAAEQGRVLDIGFGVPTPIPVVEFRMIEIGQRTANNPLYLRWEATTNKKIEEVEPFIPVGESGLTSTTPRPNAGVPEAGPPPKPQPTTTTIPNVVAQPAVDSARPPGIALDNASRDGNPVNMYPPTWKADGPFTLRIEYLPTHPWHNLPDEIFAGPFFTLDDATKILGQPGQPTRGDGVLLYLQHREQFERMYTVIALEKAIGSFPAGILIVDQSGKLFDGKYFFINQVDASFVTMPEGVAMVRDRLDPQTLQPLGGKELTPWARAIASLQAELVIRHGNIFPGHGGRWVAKGGKKQSFEHPYEMVKDLKKDGLTVFTPYTYKSADGTKRLAGVLLDRKYVNAYMEDSKISAYPYWVVTPQGEIWAPFDKQINRLPEAVREPWLKGLVHQEYPDLVEAMESRGGYLPLSVPDPATRSVLMIDRARNRLVVFREIQGASATTVDRRDFAMPVEVNRAFQSNRSIVPTLRGSLDRDGTELLVTVPDDERDDYMAASGTNFHAYPLWMIRKTDPRATALFGFRDPSRIKKFPALLNVDQLRSHARFSSEARRVVAQGGEPLEPIQFKETAGAWHGVFLQRRGNSNFLVTIKEGQPAAEVRKVEARVPDELDRLLGRFGESAEIDLGGNSNAPRILVGFRRSVVADVIDVKVAGPLWILSEGQARRPLRVARDDDWDHADEVYTRVTVLARQDALVDEMVRRTEENRPLTLLSFGRKASSTVRYLFQGAKAGEDQGWLIRVAAREGDVLAVRSPADLSEEIGSRPEGLRFQDVECEGQPALVATLDSSSINGWLTSHPLTPRRTLPLWWLSTGLSGAAFLAAGPDGITPIALATLEPGHVFELPTSARPGRLGLLRELARRGGGRPMRVFASGGTTTWTALNVEGTAFWQVVETDSGFRIDEVGCPETLRAYLVNPRAALSQVRVEVRRAAGGAVAVVWLEPTDGGKTDPRVVFESLRARSHPPTYPLWAAIATGTEGLSPLAPFAWDRANGSPVVAEGVGHPKSYRPGLLLDQPPLTMEILGTIVGGRLWRAGPAEAEGNGSLLCSIAEKSGEPSIVLIENATTRNLPPTTWRRLSLPAEVDLAGFLKASTDGSLMKDFGDTLRDLPESQGLWWAEAAPSPGGVGFAVGPATPPSGPWPANVTVRVVYARRSGSLERFRRSVPDILTAARSNPSVLPKRHSDRLGSGADPAREWEFLREVVREILRLGGTWQTNSDRDPSSETWGTDPRQLLQGRVR